MKPRYEYIRENAPRRQIVYYCKALRVRRSGYYAWLKRKDSQREQDDAALLAIIQEIHAESQGNYGSPRVHEALRKRDHHCGRKRVARLMREAGLEGVMPRKTFKTTVADPKAPAIPDRLERDFKADGPNQKWVADITLVETAEGRLFLATIIDLFSRMIVGWSMRADMTKALVMDALEMAIQRRDPTPGLIHHSDHGSQYTSQAMQDLLEKHGILDSMGSVGDCYDNAVAESGFATIKKECVYRYQFLTRQAARTTIFQYIEGFYNRKRLHSALDYQSPIAFEHNFYHSCPEFCVH